MFEKIAEHPGPEELKAYGQGRLAPEAALAVEEHLAGCKSCCELLEQAEADSFLNRLRDAQDVVGTTLPEPPAIPPELVDHPFYRVLGLIGHGGMGAVYRAEHRRMERLVALKVINPGLMRTPGTVQRFLKEVMAAARLVHPNIVNAYDAGEANGLPFLVMEYVEGARLDRLVKDRGPLPLAEACAYARQAALGLQHAHELGMVHRDVTPQNLMVTPAGQVKILDFGLVRLAHAAEGSVAGGPAGMLTTAGTVLGTADYVAPEQAADPRSADIRADVYSLGCTLFFLLAGHPPFPNGTVTEKLAQHANTPLPPLNALRADIPANLAAVVARMTAKNPADRFATPGEVAAALTPFAEPDSVRPSPARKRRRLAAIVACLALLLAGVLAAIVLWPRSDRGDVVAQKDQPREPKGAVMPEPISIPDAAELAKRPNAADALKHEDVPEIARAYLGGGDPKKAPPELVAVLGEVRFRCPGEFGPIAYSPDGKLLAVAGREGSTWIYDASTGWLARAFRSDQPLEHRLAFSPDGKTLAGITKEGTFAVVDSTTGRLLWKLEDTQLPGVSAFAIHPNGKVIGLISGASPVVEERDAATGKRLRSWTTDAKKGLKALAFHPEQPVFAVLPVSGEGILWDAARDQRHSLGRRGEQVAFSPDGTFLAVARRQDKEEEEAGPEITLYDRLGDPRVRHRLPGKEAECCTLFAFSADGKTLIAVGPPPKGSNTFLTRWDVTTGKKLTAKTIAHDWWDAPKCALRPDGKELAALRRYEIRLHDPATGELRSPPAEEQGAAMELAFSPDGKLLASSSRQRGSLWDLATGKRLRTWGHPNDGHGPVLFSPDGKLLATFLEHTGIYLRRVSDGEVVHVLSGPEKWVTTMSFSPDGKWLAAGGQDSLVWVWRVKDGKTERVFNQGCPTDVLTFSPEGRFVVSVTCNTDFVLIHWDVATGQEKPPERRVEASAYSLAFLPDGKTLAGMEFDRNVWLRDRETGAVKEMIPAPEPYKGEKSSNMPLALGPAGWLAAAETKAGQLLLWQPTTKPLRQRTLRLFPADGAGFWIVAFSPDGRYVATGNPDGTVYLLRLTEPGKAPELGEPAKP